jgi:hypothetical protein
MNTFLSRGILEMRNVPLAAYICVVTIISMSGCMSVNDGPRTRLGHYPAAIIGTTFVDSNGLGKHSYSYSLFDNGGIAYTCRGGHIDIDHLKISADYTKYLAEKTYSHLSKKDDVFTFGLDVDPSMYFVTLQYPADWQTMPKQEKEQISRQISIELGAYLTFTMVSWHEILTWYGFHTIGVLPEFPSAFSWEDSYSNLLGTRLGAEALSDKSRGYDEAMTMLIRKELIFLGEVPADTARYSAEKIRGKWFTGIVLPEISERNFDMGLETGYVTPTLVPGICPDAQPQSYPAPTLEILQKYGFKLNLEVEPRTWEQQRIFKAAYPDGNATRIKLSQDLPRIFSDIKQEARKLGYHYLPEDKYAN